MNNTTNHTTILSPEQVKAFCETRVALTLMRVLMERPERIADLVKEVRHGR